ncbi:TRP-domain-containing protein [Sparassis crispa]|uniref:TRP-domain-containing protein n=1 Tax=Sparassis crispa TaxID=139825 RepID=A0A401GFL2_9APHY|nr:TRP-domain-containing protein [Sparassis crispa]GBE80977.1 TRP-domain-containing protein [Sparassis crispa]
MFFFVARLRLATAFAVFLFSSFSRARLNELFASSVSYCAPPEEILIEQLDVSYFQANNSISFNVTAASVLPNISVSANLYLNVYGMQPLNITIDLCGLFGGALCPLPPYNFSGTDSLELPSSVNIAKEIPGIAYVIPDLEAFAQLTLVEVGTNQVKACVQCTLANGWSARQYAVEWTTGAIALLALASAVWQSVMQPIALAPARLLDILYLFQSIAASALLGLNYPSVYTAYSLNFSWALGLFAQSPTSGMQNAINNMRRLTGGNGADASSNGAVPLVNRKLSPYNAPVTQAYLASQSLLAKVASLQQVDLANAAKRAGFAKMDADAILKGRDVAVVTPQSSDVLQAGIPIYANSIGIATTNAFMTIFFVALILTAILLVALGAGYVTWLALRRTFWGKDKLDSWPGLKSGYLWFAQAWGLRTALVTFFPIAMFTFYQWTLHDSWLSVLLSVISVLIVLASILIPCFFVLRHYLPTSFPGSSSNMTTAISLSPLTAPFVSRRIFYIIPILLAIFVKALVVGFASSHGLFQAIFLLVVDVFLLASLIIAKPFRSRRADILMGFLAVVRVVCGGLLIAFAESIHLAAIPRVVIGIVTAVIFSVTVVIMFFNILVNMGIWRLIRFLLPFGRRSRRKAGDTELASSASEHDSDASAERDSEKVKEKDSGKSSERDLEKSGNPTPPSSRPLTPMSANSEQPSFYSTGTGTTLGEPLPRRWSFQYSRPPSDSQSPLSLSFMNSRHSVTSSPSSPSSGLPARYSRHISSSAPSPIEEYPMHEDEHLDRPINEVLTVASLSGS